MSLLDKRFLFVTGKGGVGKTTTCCALAHAVASEGKRVLICEFDTEPIVGRVFGSRTPRFDPIELEPNIWACNVRGPEAMEVFVRRWLRSQRITSAVTSNRIMQTFFESAPGVHDAVVLDRIGMLATESSPPFELVIVDLPATGHALTILNLPRSMARIFRVGNLSEQQHALADKISDPARSEVVLVTLPEEMPVNEAIELSRNAAEQVETPLGHVIVNSVRNVPVTEEDLAAIGDTGAEELGSRSDLLGEAIALGLHWRRVQQAHLERLREAIRVPTLELPACPEIVPERERIRYLAEQILGQVRAPKEASA